MLKRFRADLHLHTCLSPCAELDMTPRGIVDAARSRGVDIIAVTDHNSAENVEATRRAAEGTEIGVLGGMEISTAEEVHIIALFERPEDILMMQGIVYENLPSGLNDERLYGQQVVVNEHDEVLGFNTRLLITATRLGTNALVDVIGSLGGLAIASHVDREAFSIITQLGFIPETVKLDALEFSALVRREDAEVRFSALAAFPWVSFSDAHHVADIGRRVTTFTIEEPTFAEVRMALGGKDGRGIAW